MTTSEQRVRARKTRSSADPAAGQGVKSTRRRRPELREISSAWRCEGQMDQFGLITEEGGSGEDSHF